MLLGAFTDSLKPEEEISRNQRQTLESEFMFQFTQTLLSARESPLTKPMKWALGCLWWRDIRKKYATELESLDPRIFYFLTPPDRLKNLGDHAQRIVILSWLEAHFPQTPVLVFDKDETNLVIHRIAPILRERDVVILHSGGNFGDNGLWSERARRKVVNALKGNRIISLPQTISFSDTRRGKVELTTSQRTYLNHPDLLVYARDRESLEKASNWFDGLALKCAPDFVLRHRVEPLSFEGHRKRLLACLRADEESALDERMKHQILHELFDEPVDWYDTTLPADAVVGDWEEELHDALIRFGSYEAIITDRYHGLIFAVLTKTPVVVLRTTNHKLTAAMTWFEGVEFVEFATEVADIPRSIQRVKNSSSREVPNWDLAYFNEIAEEIQQVIARDS